MCLRVLRCADAVLMLFLVRVYVWSSVFCLFHEHCVLKKLRVAHVLYLCASVVLSMFVLLRVLRVSYVVGFAMCFL